jgi:hypothetical protein
MATSSIVLSRAATSMKVWRAQPTLPLCNPHMEKQVFL